MISEARLKEIRAICEAYPHSHYALCEMLAAYDEQKRENESLLAKLIHAERHGSKAELQKERDVAMADNAKLQERIAALEEALRMHMQWIGPPPVDRRSYDSLREDAWALGIKLIGNPRLARATAHTGEGK